MRTPKPLRSLDDRFLGNRLRGRRSAPVEDDDAAVGTRTETRTETVRRPPSSDGARAVLGTVYRISRLVFLALAVAVVLGILFVLAPSNPDNEVVRLVQDVSEGAAGPFKDVFTVEDDRDREVVVNYAFAAGVYLLAAALVTRLPGGKSA